MIPYRDGYDKTLLKQYTAAVVSDVEIDKRMVTFFCTAHVLFYILYCVVVHSFQSRVSTVIDRIFILEQLRVHNKRYFVIILSVVEKKIIVDFEKPFIFFFHFNRCSYLN